MSKWIATLIVSAKDKKERVLILDRCIEIAEVWYLVTRFPVFLIFNMHLGSGVKVSIISTQWLQSLLDYSRAQSIVWNICGRYGSVLLFASINQFMRPNTLHSYALQELPSKQLDLFEEMVEMISSRSSFKNFRDYIHKCHPPCVPYLGMPMFLLLS